MESTAGSGVGSGVGSGAGSGAGARFSLPREEDIDAFLSRVDEVTEKVQHILSGKITAEEMQQEEQKLLLKEKIRQMREEERREEERRRYVMGTRGSGTKENNYQCFCAHCLVEFKYVLTTCPRCAGKVVTREERLNDLQEKVKQYKERKKKRDARRASWKSWQRGINRKDDASEVISGNDDGVDHHPPRLSASTDYVKWNLYEPSSDTFDEDEKISYVPKHNANFKILEKNLQRDLDRKNQHRRVAHSMKLRGNEFFKKKNYIQAIECYEEALQVCKDYLEIYNNVALCYLKTFRYEQAVRSCNEVIQYYDVFKGDFRVKGDLLYKSHLRKGLALYKLFSFGEALASFQSALEFSPGGAEAAAYVQRCERMLRGGGHVKGDHSGEPLSGGTHFIEPLSRGTPPPGRTDAANGQESSTDLSRALTELAKMDLIKDGEKFWETLKGVKRSLKRSEEAKVAFYAKVYSLEPSGGGTCGEVVNRKGRTTFLSFCANKLEELLLYVKREQREGGKLPKHTSLSAGTLIDLITLTLEDHHECADFCLGAVNPLLTLYQLKKINKVKTAHLLNTIGRDPAGRSLLHERVMQQEDYTLLGRLLSRMGHLIQEERRVYTKEQRALLSYLTECILNEESVRRYGVDGDLSGGILHGGRAPKGGASEESTKGAPPIAVASEECDKGTPPIAGAPADPWKELHKRRFELANLFGIISHLTLKQDGRDVLERKFTKDMLNVIVYANEQFYSLKGMPCNCLSLLVNLVGSASIRAILIRASWPHMLHFVENIAPGGERRWSAPAEERRRSAPAEALLLGDPPRENLLENVLSLLLNLTSAWKEQLKEGGAVSPPPGEKTLVREGSLRRIISCMGSANRRVAELSCLLLSQFYTYAYHGVVDLGGGKKMSPPPRGREERTRQSDHHVSPPQEDPSEGGRNVQLVDSLKRKIETEIERQIHLDECSFERMRRSILSELDSPRGGSLTNACVHILCCLSKCTDFLEQLLYRGETHLEGLATRLVSLFVNNNSTVERDQCTSMMVKNIAAFFTQLMKLLTVRGDTARGSASVVKSIERVIPHAAELVGNGVHSDGRSKEISFFLSYCFVHESLKPAVLAAFHNDAGRLFAGLHSGAHNRAA
ncbi:hypothetical protein, conserved [Plasmodium vivax]|uniref:Uncharacterized protein n=1 Tax=Plasmodium vivax (strain Salvador I) TaxID=126793 RepID=A5KBD5_PLAVS|nr:hypothetical protein, conserved [Plasmodium vivax]EDL43413.1 hypothetical protein, conserved [Plasmodium vivax]|eukprot:XP_001613140.1 hypothetical protein [Plasmodium vivax Sal-1]